MNKLSLNTLYSSGPSMFVHYTEPTIPGKWAHVGCYGNIFGYGSYPAKKFVKDSPSFLSSFYAGECYIKSEELQKRITKMRREAISSHGIEIQYEDNELWSKEELLKVAEWWKAAILYFAPTRIHEHFSFILEPEPQHQVNNHFWIYTVQIDQTKVTSEDAFILLSFCRCLQESPYGVLKAYELDQKYKLGFDKAILLGSILMASHANLHGDIVGWGASVDFNFLSTTPENQKKLVLEIYKKLPQFSVKTVWEKIYELVPPNPKPWSEWNLKPDLHSFFRFKEEVPGNKLKGYMAQLTLFKFQLSDELMQYYVPKPKPVPGQVQLERVFPVDVSKEEVVKLFVKERKAEVAATQDR